MDKQPLPKLLLIGVLAWFLIDFFGHSLLGSKLIKDCIING